MSEKNVMMGIMVPEDLKAALKAAAKENGYSNLSQFVVAILKQKPYIKNKKIDWWREKTDRSDT